MTKLKAPRHATRFATTSLVAVVTAGILLVALGFLSNGEPTLESLEPNPRSGAFLGPGFLPNGGFENDFFGWVQVDSAALSEDVVHSGTKAFRAMDLDSSRYAYVYQELGFAYDSTQVEFWVYPETDSYYQFFELISNWRPGPASLITRVTLLNGFVAFSAVDTTAGFNNVLISGAWTKITVKANGSSLTQDFYVNDSLYASLPAMEFPIIEHFLVGDLSVTGNYGSLVYDDISITGSVTTPVPVAVDDEYVDQGDEAKFFPVLRNDVIPAGASFEISIVDPPEHGEILSIEEDGIWVQKEQGFEGDIQFSYTLVEPGQSVAKNSSPVPPAYLLWIAVACACHYYSKSVCGDGEVDDESGALDALLKAKGALAADSLDLGLLSRWRDELLRSTEKGTALFEDMLFNSPEILQIALIDQPQIRGQIVRLFLELQSPARSMLEGNGSEAITQAHMDSVAALFASISDNASDELAAIIQGHVDALGPFDKYVGMTVKEAFEALGGGTGTAIEQDVPTIAAGFVLEPSFPNPFDVATTIRYTLEDPARVNLAIYDIRGRKVRTLARGQLEQGTRTVIWTGQDDSGVEVPSGVYFVRLSSDAVHRTKRLVVVR